MIAVVVVMKLEVAEGLRGSRFGGSWADGPGGGVYSLLGHKGDISSWAAIRDFKSKLSLLR